MRIKHKIILGCVAAWAILTPVIASAQVNTNFWKVVSNILSPVVSTWSISDPILGTPAGTFVAADPTGKLIATTTPSGGSGITTLTGDVTASGSGSVAATLATVNTNTGSWGSSTAIPNFTVNGKGLITAAGTNVVIAPAGTLSGTTLNSTVVTSSLTSASLATLTATDGTLTFSGSYNGNTARTVGLNLGNANTWTGQQIFSSANVGIGTTTPFSKLSISTAAQQSGLLPLFTVASTTSANLLTVLGNGAVEVGTSTNTTAGTLQVGVVTGDQGVLINGNGTNNRGTITFGANGANIQAAFGNQWLSFNNSSMILTDAGQIRINSINNPNGVLIPVVTALSVTPNADDVAFRVIAKSGSVLDLQQWQNSSGAVLDTVSNGGNLGLGTSTPYATLSIQSGASTGDAFAVATSSGNAIGGYDNDGHRFTSGPAPVISACGTGTGTVVGDDQGGVITTATTATACTLTFSKAYRVAPYCTASDNSLAGFADITTISTAAITFGISAPLTAGKIYYSCAYHK